MDNNLQDNIISTPLIFPKIIPTDWNTWWKLWFKESTYLRKSVINHNSRSAAWKGFDIFVHTNTDAPAVTGYESKYIDCNGLFPSLFNNLQQLPIDVKVIKAVSSYTSIQPHSDFNDKIFSIRTLLYDNNVFDNFYYMVNNNKIYQKLPNDTNTWGYWDHKSHHGTDFYYGHSKILLMFYGPMKTDFDIQSSINYYKNYVIYG
jgi:hypothetical protein